MYPVRRAKITNIAVVILRIVMESAPFICVESALNGRIITRIARYDAISPVESGLLDLLHK